MRKKFSTKILYIIIFLVSGIMASGQRVVLQRAQVPEAVLDNVDALKAIADAADVDPRDRAEAFMRLGILGGIAEEAGLMVESFLRADRMGRGDAIPGLFAASKNWGADARTALAGKYASLAPADFHGIADGARAEGGVPLDTVKQAIGLFEENLKLADPRAVTITLGLVRRGGPSALAARKVLDSGAGTPTARGLLALLDAGDKLFPREIGKVAQSAAGGQAGALAVLRYAMRDLDDDKLGAAAAAAVVAAANARPEALEEARDVLGQGMPELRRRLLAAMAEDTLANADLRGLAVSAFQQRSPWIRAAAVAALFNPAFTGDPSAMDCLAKAASDPAENVRAELALHRGIAALLAPAPDPDGAVAWWVHAVDLGRRGALREVFRALGKAKAPAAAEAAAAGLAGFDYVAVQMAHAISGEPEVVAGAAVAARALAPKAFEGMPGALIVLARLARDSEPSLAKAADAAIKKTFPAGTAEAVAKVAGAGIEGRSNAVAAAASAMEAGESAGREGLRLLSWSPDSGLASEALAGLLRAGRKQAPARDAALQLAKSGEAMFRARLAGALGRVLGEGGDPGLAEALVKLSKDLEPSVREATVRGLLAPEVREEPAAKDALRLLGQDEADSVRAELALWEGVTLEGQGGGSLRDAMGQYGVAGELGHAEAGARMVGLWLRAAEGERASLFTVAGTNAAGFRAMMAATGPWRGEPLEPMAKAVRDLGPMAAEPGGARQQLLAGLAAGDAGIKKAALEALGAAFPATVAPFLEAIYSGPVEERTSAIAKVAEEGRQGSADAVKAVAVAARDSDPDARKAAADWLGAVAGTSDPALAEVRALATDPDPAVRQLGVTALNTVSARRPEILAILTNAANDADEGVRLAAVLALSPNAVRQNQAATEALIKAVEDPDPKVSGTALDALGGALSGGNEKARTFLQSVAGGGQSGHAGQARRWLEQYPVRQ